MSQYILEPLKVTAVCQSSATKSLIRSLLDFPDNKALAYAEFKRADSILYPPEHVRCNRIFIRRARIQKDFPMQSPPLPHSLTHPPMLEKTLGWAERQANMLVHNTHSTKSI